MICVDSGYEIHVGGAAGLHIKGTEILTKVATGDAGNLGNLHDGEGS